MRSYFGQLLQVIPGHPEVRFLLGIFFSLYYYYYYYYYYYLRLNQLLLLFKTKSSWNDRQSGWS